MDERFAMSHTSTRWLQLDGMLIVDSVGYVR